LYAIADNHQRRLQVQSMSDMKNALAESRAETDNLFRIVADDDLFVRPLPQRHRLIFYLGHLEAFDWNQAGRMALGEPHVEKTLDQLFARGIDPDPGQLPSDQESDWPTIDQAQAYVARVRGNIDRIWDRVPADVQQTAVEHRWMHAETLAYQLHNLPFEKKRKPASAVVAPGGPKVQAKFLTIPAGEATLGRKPNGKFGWDNEFNETSVNVPEFSVTEYKVTNADYLEFVNQGQQAPFFWTRQGEHWQYRGMFETVPLPLDAPVYVTQQEATEYAKWRGADLLTEPQFHRAAYGTTQGDERDLPWGDQADAPGNFDFRNWDPTPVTQDTSRSAFGAAQMVGNGWEWTRTPFGPLPGFEPMPNYPGYSADFFDDKHFVLKGASPRTAKILTRRSLRNWFRPDYPYLYATFRLVVNS
jgi:iron(II)-dependent oxidoreductase